jgi:dTDP-4-dehydrorhamnose 3,5-epimerase-like enzyme
MDIKIIPLQTHGDDRGNLVSLEEAKNIPFPIKRVYYMYDTKTDTRRGFHAHLKLKQLVVALKGSCRFVLDDAKERIEVVLDNPAQGLIIDSLVWREMYDFSEDCVLMVLADSLFDESDYIRNYEEFSNLVNKNVHP